MGSSDEPGKKRYTIVKGFINGREATLNLVYGMFVCVSAPDNTGYAAALFSRESADAKMPLSEMISRINGERPADREESLTRYERELTEYIKVNRIFQSEQDPPDVKALERKISYFCVESIQLNVITFIEITSIDEDDLRSLIPSMPEPAESESADGADSEAGGRGERGEEGNDGQGIYISCNPALDPVSGVAAGEIEAGESIYCVLPEGSSFYKLLEKNSPDFDGTVIGDVAEVRTNEFGSAIITLTLAEGISGLLKVSGAVRVKLKSKGLRGKGRRKITGTDIAIAVTGIVLFLCVMGVILRFT